MLHQARKFDYIFLKLSRQFPRGDFPGPVTLMKQLKNYRWIIGLF